MNRAPLPFGRGFQRALSPLTVATYRDSFAAVESWCRCYGLDPLSPEGLRWYVATHQDLALATLRLRVAAVNRVCHERGRVPAGYRWGVIVLLKALARRRRGTRQKQAFALTVATLTQINGGAPMTDLHGLDALDRTKLRRLRDVALILVSFAGAFRPIAVTSIYIEDARRLDDGTWRLWIRHDKTHPTGFAREVGHTRGHDQTCPGCRIDELVAALRQRGIEKGPLFSPLSSDGSWSGKCLRIADVGKILKRLARDAGLSHLCISGRSPRRGAAQTASRGGATLGEVKELLGDRTDSAARRYLDGGEGR